MEVKMGTKRYLCSFVLSELDEKEVKAAQKVLMEGGSPRQQLNIFSKILRVLKKELDNEEPKVSYLGEKRAQSGFDFSDSG